MVCFRAIDDECGTLFFSLRLLLLVVACYHYANGQQGIMVYSYLEYINSQARRQGGACARACAPPPFLAIIIIKLMI